MTTHDLARQFARSERPHILMITNHGIHDWEVRTGMIDTGGQNHYVNALSDTLVALGFRVTTCNRGGFPDPVTHEIRRGHRYKDAHSRITFLEGGDPVFIRKEELTPAILREEAAFAAQLLAQEQLPVTLIISHYWDAALLANYLKERSGLAAKHVWIPHSIGALKKANFRDKPAEVTVPLRFDERIAFEKEALWGNNQPHSGVEGGTQRALPASSEKGNRECDVFAGVHGTPFATSHGGATRAPVIDAVASTSGDISRVLRESYDRDPELFLPPCIDTTTIFPMPTDAPVRRIHDFLATQDRETGARVQGRPCVLEMSRTDRTKRKDVVIRAFAELLRTVPEAMLLLTISPDSTTVYAELTALVTTLGIRDHVVYIGIIPREIVHELYAITTVYISPSDQEGFGMSVQEACASRRAAIASDRVPFAVEYLLPNATTETIATPTGPCEVRWGEGGVVVPAGNIAGFAHALQTLFRDTARRERLADGGYRLTIPYFTWPHLTRTLLSQMGITL